MKEMSFIQSESNIALKVAIQMFSNLTELKNIYISLKSISKNNSNHQ